MEVTYSQEFTLLSLVRRYRVPQYCLKSFTVLLSSFIRNNVADKLDFGLQNWHFAVLTVKPALVNLFKTKSL